VYSKNQIAIVQKIAKAVPSSYRRPEVFGVLRDSCPEGGAAREACADVSHHPRCVDANLSSLEAFCKPLRCPGIMESLTFQFFAAKSLLQPNTL
jgi:hypothetical protein